MKAKNLLKTLVILLCAINFISCNDDVDDRWYDKMPDGGLFHSGHSLRFFYVDEAGNDLIDPTDLSTLPVSNIEQLEPAMPESLRKDVWYNSDLNCILYNKEEKKYEFFTFAFGDSRRSNYTFYVFHKGNADQMDVTFKYQSDKVNGGQDYASIITSWKVNGKEIYTDKDTALRKYIFLIKKSDGTTSISFGEKE